MDEGISSNPVIKDQISKSTKKPIISIERATFFESSPRSLNSIIFPLRSRSPKNKAYLSHKILTLSFGDLSKASCPSHTGSLEDIVRVDIFLLCFEVLTHYPIKITSPLVQNQSFYFWTFLHRCHLMQRVYLDHYPQL